MLSTFDKHDKTQLLAKFKKSLYMEFRATLNFRKFKVALNPRYDCHLHFYFQNARYFISAFSNIKKRLLRVGGYYLHIAFF